MGILKSGDPLAVYVASFMYANLRLARFSLCECVAKYIDWDSDRLLLKENQRDQGCPGSLV
jgi:hypothetical protein